MEKSIDLSGVDPARWPEIRRRVAILNEYTALHRPSREVRLSYAKRMGIGDSHFIYLAQIWRTERSASALPGARSATAPKARRIAARSIRLMRETIAELGAMARRKDVIAEVARRCTLAEVAVPSNTTIANALIAARSQMREAADLEPEILIDECLFKLPVDVDGTIVMPRALLAVVLPQRRIVAAEISCDPLWAPSLDALMETLTAATTPDGIPLRIRAPHRPRTERVRIGALSRDESLGQPALGRVLGARIGGLSVIYQASKARAVGSMVGGRHASAISPDDATLAIRDAIEAHNAALPALPADGFSLRVRIYGISEAAQRLKDQPQTRAEAAS